jgi:hypothetical protein
MRIQFAFAAVIGTLAALSLSVPAEAQINKRQNQQQQRIAKGISSGRLTAREAARLEQQQARIDRVEGRSRASGRGINRTERARINRMQNHASHSIRRQKHDRQRRR